MLYKLALLALAGGLGTLARYGLSGIVQQGTGGWFPWGTLAANVLGCFAAGAFWSAAEGHLSISGESRTLVLVGFMGAFTTFSTYILETGNLMRDAEWSWALGNVAVQNVCGIAALLVGLAAGRLI
jgi:CrcB protein